MPLYIVSFLQYRCQSDQPNPSWHYTGDTDTDLTQQIFPLELNTHFYCSCLLKTFTFKVMLVFLFMVFKTVADIGHEGFLENFQ